MLKKSILTSTFCLSYITGIFFGLNIYRFSLIITFCLIIFTLIFYFLNNPYCYYLLCISGLMAGAYLIQSQTEQQLSIITYETSISLTGTITEAPLTKNLKQYLVVGGIHDDAQNYQGQAKITTSTLQNFEYGQTIIFNGPVEKPEDFSPDFSYQGYLAKDEIYYLSSFPDIKIISPANYNFFNYLYKLKQILEQRIYANHPPPLSNLLSGLLLGSKHGLPDQTYQAFKITGLTHIIVVSGFNLTIFSSLFLKFLRGKLPRLVSLAVTIFCLFAFTVITGAEASIVRAFIMICLMIIGPFLSRQSTGIHAIILAAAVMIHLNPLILWYDPGFHLSFLATIGLIFLGQPLTDFWHSLPIPRFISTTLAETLAASLPTLPYVAYTFKQISSVFLLSNIIVLPLIPYAMLLGFISLLTSLIPWTALNQIVSLPANLLLKFIIFSAQSFSQIPFASLTVHLDFFDLSICYVLIVILYFFLLNYGSNNNQKNSSVPVVTTGS